MSTAQAGVPPEPGDAAEVEALIPLLRRVVGARVGGHPAAEDLVQETLVRVLAARDRVTPGMLEAYAIATAKNVVASMWRTADRATRNQHRLHDPVEPEKADELLVASEEARAMSTALDRLHTSDRQLLLAHDVGGRATRSLAEETDSTAGAVAAQLKRTRARLRVEYLLALEQVEPPTDKCRAVLLALSGADRRRQGELDAARHLLECDVCDRLSGPLLGRGPDRPEEVRVPVSVDPDIVTARQAARELAARAGFDGVDLTLLATAVSEIARNILRFAGEGEVVIELVERPRPGLRVVARDTGPGIADVEQALRDGWSTDEGLGLGLPGARRLMDEFSVTSEVGRGTTVSMAKWIERG
ncbi:sigma-70 family RNA polymerase sigma factor [Ornithinimicrobium cerasi]|uniref:Serine/threonine-protein kinase RsbT n=1 Tax=Ornithinimicrobium cerasi TaxID=2248773 RepID=A0A285VTN4_9MICO|nr:sigma-70 family RNA polymerase sigma factor [Ornithinimicrobium cerasi]SOC57247.1 serine/threonine-protein kinase RsbT [Ornithinimicrobium cerasi]